MSSRKYSKELVDGPNQAASRSMLRGVGFTTEDFTKPFIGVASTGAKVTPCNMHINLLADHAAKGVNTNGGKAIIFNTITVSDGISMGTPGMKYSLISREVIADSIETVSGAEGFDGVLTIGGCDKNMPGCLFAMARLNRPSIFIYGGGDFNKLLVNGILDISNKKNLASLKYGNDEKNLEATTFAWFAYARDNQVVFKKSNITGAKENYYLGNIY